MLPIAYSEPMLEAPRAREVRLDEAEREAPPAISCYSVSVRALSNQHTPSLEESLSPGRSEEVAGSF